MGSTVGLPDCWVPISYDVVGLTRETQVHLELKVGKIKGNHLHYHVRPEQRREIRAMLRDGVSVGLVIGIEGTDVAVFALPNKRAMDGKLLLCGSEAEKNTKNISTKANDQFYDGVFFIFSGSRRISGFRAEVGRVWKQED